MKKMIPTTMMERTPRLETAGPSIEFTETFLARKADRMALPLRLGGGNRPTVELGHWADGSEPRELQALFGQSVG